MEKVLTATTNMICSDKKLDLLAHDVVHHERATITLLRTTI